MAANQNKTPISFKLITGFEQEVTVMLFFFLQVLYFVYPGWK